MIIIEKPYASELLLKTIANCDVSVLSNNSAKELNNKKYNLKYLDEESAINLFKDGKEYLLYSNSENSLEWITKNLPFSNAAKNIEIFKNKAKFRKILTSIYPDFFYREIDFEALWEVNFDELPLPFVIKPTVGFLSFGVYTIRSKKDWDETLNSIKDDIKKVANIFPKVVVDSSKFIIEEMIEGDEYAVDVYFSKQSTPVILNIFQHPFLNEKDVSDRIYITSKNIIKDNLNAFNSLLEQLGKLIDLNYFPMHIELRKTPNGKVIPIEANPMRFAGWCTTDMAFGAYGINVYEHYFNQTTPDWDAILAQADDKISYFAMAEVPASARQEEKFSFDYNGFCKNFSEIYDLRKLDYKKHPLFAIIFGKAKEYSEVEKILALKTSDYIC